ncbi:MAG: hypothetical protein K6E79_03115 [Pseudobutyrivibrio sp.]|nr:hypothetical protein [Pseudobutyrivibrio sp.]
MYDERIVIKHNLKYRALMLFTAVLFSGLGVLFLVGVLVSEPDRVYCITDNIWFLLGILIGAGFILLMIYGAIGSVYNRVILEGQTMIIKQAFTKTVVGSPDIVDYYSIKKKQNSKIHKEIEIYYDDACLSFSTDDLSKNYQELIDFLKEYCSKGRGHKRQLKKKEKIEYGIHAAINGKSAEEYKTNAEKWHLKSPSVFARKYVMYSRYAINAALLIFFFFIQKGEIVPSNILWKVCIVAFLWAIIRLIFWQDAIAVRWIGDFPDKVECKNKFWFNPDFFLVTPLVGLVLIYLRSRNACERYHIYELGNMNYAIIIATIALWLVMTIIKNVFYGRNKMPFKNNLLRQILFLFVTLMLTGQIIYCGTIMLAENPTEMTAVVCGKSSQHSRRSGTRYNLNVYDENGVYADYNVWSNTYSKYDEGDEVTILVYDTILGSEYRHLEESYR